MDIKRMMKPLLIALACIAAAVVVIVLSGTPLHFSMNGADKSAESTDAEKIPIRVLILPKFEIGEMTGDDFWKGPHDHVNAESITKNYGCPDPYAITDMEEIAVGNVIKRLGMTDRFISVRVSVNMDTFLKGESPESLWSTGASVINNDSSETLDIFPVAMMNNYRVVSAVIEAIENGEL